MAEEGTPDAAAADQGDDGKQGTPPTGGNDSWKPPASQADLDKIIDRRMSSERAKYGMTPDEAKAFKAQAESAEAANASDAEKREKQARKDAEAAADAKYRPQLAETAFRIAIGERLPAANVDDFIADTNLARFITDDGKVDTAKVLARVAQLTGAVQQQQTPAPRGPVIPGHNPGTPATVKPGDSARAALAARGIKID